MGNSPFFPHFFPTFSPFFPRPNLSGTFPLQNSRCLEITVSTGQGSDMRSKVVKKDPKIIFCCAGSAAKSRCNDRPSYQCANTHRQTQQNRLEHFGAEGTVHCWGGTRVRTSGQGNQVFSSMKGRFGRSAVFNTSGTTPLWRLRRH